MDEGSSHGQSEQKPFTIVVSSKVLFDMELDQKILNHQGPEDYINYEVGREKKPFGPGPAFKFVKALQAVNAQLREHYPGDKERLDVIVINNDEHVKNRLENTIRHHQLCIEHIYITLSEALKAHQTTLFLSGEQKEVRAALQEGIPAATMFSPKDMIEVSETPLCVAFDGDCVLFSGESEQIYKTKGLEAYLEHEKKHQDSPMSPGPLKGFLDVLQKLQEKFYDKGMIKECPIQTCLVTARSPGGPAIRAMKTLQVGKQNKKVEMTRAYFLGSASKGPILKEIKPHIFFDDQIIHVESALKEGVVACHVPNSFLKPASHTSACPLPGPGQHM